MNIIDNPIAQNFAGPILEAAADGPLGQVLEFVGVTNPEALGDLGGSPGEMIATGYEAFGFDPQFASALGAAADASVGNVGGAVSGAGEATGNEEAAQIATLAGQIPM